MATIRRAGFGSVFEVENETVGIGTTGTATNTLQVLGDIKSSDATVIGLSTLTTYQGFVDKEARFGKALIDVESQAGTLGEIVIDGDVTVSSASTLCSSLNQLTLTDSFSVPTGNTDSRIHCHTAGSMRLNEDFGTLEFYTGDEWRTVNSFKDTGNRGRVIFMGGSLDYPNSAETDNIDFITLSTLGNSVNFGVLTSANDQTACCGSAIRGFRFGGNRPMTDRIDFVTFASEGNAIDFGNQVASRYGCGSCSSSTRGFYIGGYDSSNAKEIDAIEMMTSGNAVNFGELTRARRYGSSFSSPTRGFFTGGSPSSDTRGIDVFTMASKGNGVNFGNATEATSQLGGFANITRAIYANNQSEQVGLEYITMASEGNAIDFGDLGRETAAELGNGCNHVRGVLAGGFNTPGSASVNNIDLITIATLGDAQDFGDLSKPTSLFKGCSDSHGGLGGF